MGPENFESRLALAEEFFELAIGGSEVQMRNSLSRLYYASFHLAAALTGLSHHGEIAKRLGGSYGEVGQGLKKMHDLRCAMDYWPNGVVGRAGGENRRLWFQREMQTGMDLYEQLRQILETRKQVEA